MYSHPGEVGLPGWGPRQSIMNLPSEREDAIINHDKTRASRLNRGRLSARLLELSNFIINPQNGNFSINHARFVVSATPNPWNMVRWKFCHCWLNSGQIARETIRPKIGKARKMTAPRIWGRAIFSWNPRRRCLPAAFKDGGQAQQTTIHAGRRQSEHHPG